MKKSRLSILKANFLFFISSQLTTTTIQTLIQPVMNSLDTFFVSVLIKGFYRRRLQQRETQSLKASRWNLLRTAAVDHPLLPLKLHCSPPRGAQVLYMVFSITLQREARQHEYFLECVCVFNSSKRHACRSILRRALTHNFLPAVIVRLLI